MSLEEKFKKYVETEKTELPSIFFQLTLYIYQQKINEHDLYILAKLLNYEDLIKLINYYDGGLLKLPTKKEFKESYILAVCFFLKEIKNWDWKKIKQCLDLSEEDLNSYKLGYEINKLKNSLNKDLTIILEYLKSKEEQQNG